MRPNTLRLLRRYHQYLGLFFAPWIILFSVSGALQTFRLNEAKGYGGPPPQWMVWLSAVHKDQGPPRTPRAEKPRTVAAAVDEHDHDHADEHDHADAAPKAGQAVAVAQDSKRPNPLPLKIFVVLLSLSLIVSTLMGVVIALANRAVRRSSMVLLVLGAVIPAVLLWL